MKSYIKFYEEELYPLQDGILKIVRDLKLPFYLTGGTALSRYYFKHRYSDVIELFVNSDSSYPEYVKRLTESLINQPPEFYSFLSERFVKSEDYTQIYVERVSVILKIDLVNDIELHFGEFAEDKTLGKVDSWRNILSNKITAAFRMEIKDFIDIWCISEHNTFNWVEIFNEAKRKDPGGRSYFAIRSFQKFSLRKS